MHARTFRLRGSLRCEALTSTVRSTRPSVLGTRVPWGVHVQIVIIVPAAGIHGTAVCVELSCLSQFKSTRTLPPDVRSTASRSKVCLSVTQWSESVPLAHRTLQVLTQYMFEIPFHSRATSFYGIMISCIIKRFKRLYCTLCV